MTGETTADVPSGYLPFAATSPFMSLMGPLYQRPVEDGIVVALRVSTVHTNMHGIAHGGLLATLADNALGYNVSRAGQSPVVTVHMSTDYLAPARPGDWLEAHVSIQKRGRQLAFAECRLLVGSRCILKSTAIFSDRRTDSNRLTMT